MTASKVDTLSQLDSPAQASEWLRARGCKTLTSDSRRVSAKAGFLAWPGRTFDARRHVATAIEDGAIACLVDSTGATDFEFESNRVAGIANLKQIAGEIAHHFYDTPSAKLDVFAVTGTNGKTSTAWWLSQALAINDTRINADLSLLNSEHQSQSIRRPSAKNTQKSGISCLMVGTLGHGQVPHITSGDLTTPDAVALHGLIGDAVIDGASSAVIEASSVGIVEHRLSGLAIRVAIFTNCTHDHLDYHGDMASYWHAKRRLFDTPGLRSAVINIDDPKGAELAHELSAVVARPIELWTISTQMAARISARNIAATANGMRFDVVLTDPTSATVSRAEVKTPSFGQFNVSNLLGVIAAQLAVGIDLTDAASALAQVLPVPGRLEVVAAKLSAEYPVAVIDYAHTPDALEKALLATKELAVARRGQLWCVFGCGGNRDVTKRPAMGAIAQSGADHVVVTSDNPRLESPSDIATDIVAGLRTPNAATVELDRAVAIRDTLRRARANDVVLIAGKGHETYQEIAGVKHPFSDREIAQSVLGALEAGQDSKRMHA